MGRSCAQMRYEKALEPQKVKSFFFGTSFGRQFSIFGASNIDFIGYHFMGHFFESISNAFGKVLKQFLEQLLNRQEIKNERVDFTNIYT